MNPIKAPLSLGQTGTEVANLQETLLLLISSHTLILSNEALVNELADEYTKKLYGEATSAIVKALQIQEEIATERPGITDTATAAAINAAVAALQPPLVVTIAGSVKSASGNAPAIPVTVEISQVAYGSVPAPFATLTTDDAGNFSMKHLRLAGTENTTLGYHFKALHAASEALLAETTIYERSNDVHVDLVSEVAIDNVPTEYDAVMNALIAVPGMGALSAIDISDAASIEHLSRTIAEDKKLIVLMVQAKQLSARTGDANTELIYGLLRQNLPVDLATLSAQPVEVITHALRASVAGHIIAASYEEDIELTVGAFFKSMIAALTSSAGGISKNGSFYRIIQDGMHDSDSTTSTGKVQDFLTVYNAYNPGTDGQDFWIYLHRQKVGPVAENQTEEELDPLPGRFDNYVAVLKLAIALATITGNNPALVKELRSVSQTPLATWLNTLDETHIGAKITAAKTDYPQLFFYPDALAGNTEEENKSAYTAQILQRIGNIYPTHAMQKLIAADDKSPFAALKAHLDPFLENNPDFDLRTIPVAALSAAGADSVYNFSGITTAQREAFLSEAGIAQRLINVTDSYPLMAAMKQDGLHSSMKIAQLSQDAFVSRYSLAAGSTDSARQAHILAVSVNTSAAMAITRVLASVNGNMPIVFGNTSIGAATTGVLADWRTLFGSLDSCNCSQCQSVYSPAAYLTDLLQFLRQNMPDLYADLNARRPDIRNIGLTCKNTNTPVPHIDIVNELLEDLASSGAYQLYARQTMADAATQRAIPEYVNTNGMAVSAWDDGAAANVTPASSPLATPYNKLKNAAYPWALPYNFYKRQIDTHLDIAGIKDYEISQRFGPLDALEAWNASTDFHAEYLGITKEERDIICGSPVTLSLQSYYGMAGSTIPDPTQKGSSISISAASWNTDLTGHVDVFLQQTGLGYTDLLQILDCYTINPQKSSTERKMDIAAYSTATPDTCDLSKLYIEGMDLAVLGRLHRFVRLKRALGWSYYELDKALISLKASTVSDEYQYNTIPIDETNFKALVQMQRLSGLLNLSVADLAGFGKDIDTLPYRDYTKSEPKDIPSEYTQLFRNQIQAKLDEPGYPFKEVPSVTSTTAADMLHVENYLAGILNIDGDQLKQLLVAYYGTTTPQGFTLPFTMPGSTLPVLSRIRREVMMLKALNLTVSEWLQYRAWIGNAGNFGAGSSAYEAHADAFTRPYDALRFVSFVSLSRSSALPIDTVEYLLRDASTDTLAEHARDAAITKTLNGLRTELSKKYLPVYMDNSTTPDTDGSVLKGLLLPYMKEDNATHLIEAISAVPNPLTNPDGTLVTDERKFFLNDQAGFFLSFNPSQPNTAAGLTATIASLVNYSGTAASRRAIVYNALLAYVQQSILSPLIISFMAKEFKLSEDMTALLLNDCINYSTTVGGIPTSSAAMQKLLSQDFISDNVSPVRLTDTYHVFMMALRIHKAALLINTFRLNTDDVRSLWADGVLPGILQLSALPVSSGSNTQLIPSAGTAAVTFQNWLAFLRWMNIRSFLQENMPVLYDAIASLPAAAPTAKANMLTQISLAFKMGIGDVTTLLDGTLAFSSLNGVLDADFTATVKYQSPQLYQRLIDCLEMQHLLPSTMATLAKIAVSVNTPDDQQKANEVIQAVKSQYDDAQWPDVIRPVNDLLRTERRDALVAYLLANPPAGYQYKWRTSNDIFETLMLDVDMMSCMATTRILLAINTVQLWVDRVLLGLETGLTLSKANARQWHMWRKLYRVWEANRKIFLYPENWLEPELRDGKSPFFIELEKFLKQNELSDQNVEDAYRTYLERLDEVAHLDVVGMYREAGPNNQNYQSFNYEDDVTLRDTIHVFGRTKAQPHIYYYRKRVADEWTPWEKMDVQVDGDHFVPVMWRGRLRFYWLVFMKDQQAESTTGLRSNDTFTTPSPVRWKINLAWTEYKNNKWSAKQMSKDAVYSRFIVEEDPESKYHVFYYATDKWGESRNWNFKGDLEKIREKYINMFCDYDEQDNPRIRVTERDYSCSFLFLNSLRGAADNMTMQEISDIVKNNEEYMGDAWPYSAGYFNIKFNGIFAVSMDNTPLIPSFYNDNPHLGQIDFHANDYKIAKTNYWYIKSPGDGYQHYPDDVKLLNYAPGSIRTTTGNVAKAYIGTPDPTLSDPNPPESSNLTSPKILKSASLFRVTEIKYQQKGKYITFPRVVPRNYSGNTKILMPYFFYKDYDNSFFVEKIVQKNPGKSYISGGIIPSKGSTASSKPGYRFHNFSHSRVDDFGEKLFTDGLEGLLNRDFIFGLSDTMEFYNTYQPTGDVLEYPDNKVEFRPEAAYSLYNWELFYHIPLLIANKLSNDQKFEEARRWYHFVFNPTAGNDVTGSTTQVRDFWNFPEFYSNAGNIPSPTDVMNDPALATAITRWANNPFNPDLVAKTRISAYMKNVVMKYLDNLIAWGDDLYRIDTRENINEATLLYVLAAQLLGRPPQKIPARATPQVQTYASMVAGNHFNAFGNAVVNIENFLLPSGAVAFSNPHNYQLPTAAQSMYYFCMLPNDKLASYWDIVGDRLFKIRHCQSIDGIERELALFDPPIDPGLLVRAAAAGLSIADAVAGITAPLPNYRFNVMSQKATELAGEVKSLGSQLLSALEKKDAEHLALLRSGQEASLLDAITEIKTSAIEESAAQVNALGQQQAMAAQRRDFYQRAIDGGLNAQEQLQLDSLMISVGLQVTEAATTALAAILHMIPEFTIGAFSFGATSGGESAGKVTAKGADILGIAAGINNAVGSMAATKGSFARRKDEWQLQLKTTNTELKQLDKQILAAQIRKAMAEVELKNHQLQIQHNAEMDTAMREKYTSEDLYDWMTGQISFTYFQAYKLALDMAKRAERCYHYELPADTTMFIEPAYWDSLRKGLLAGESLSYDIKRMEVAYMDKNKRQLELSKHISLAMLNPQSLIDLKTKRSATVELPEWLFDLDYPGQHMRRIKSVSISIPCVAGPYTTVSCKLSLLKSKYRKTGTGGAAAYDPATIDDYFNFQYGNIQSIATSHAQNDSGMFEFSFRDERYLPFEGAGAIGTWKIELPAAYAQFDYDSIQDVILHVNYTAVDEGALKAAAAGNVHALMNTAAATGGGAGNGFYRLFDLKHEFPNEWAAMLNGAGHKLVLQHLDQRLPYLAQAGTVSVDDASFVIERSVAASTGLDIYLPATATVSLLGAKIPSPAASTSAWWKHHVTAATAPGITSNWELTIKDGNNYIGAADVKNMYLLVHYTVTITP